MTPLYIFACNKRMHKQNFMIFGRPFIVNETILHNAEDSSVAIGPSFVSYLLL